MPVAILEAAGALTRVADAPALADWVTTMLRDPARRSAMGEAGRIASRRARRACRRRWPTMLAELLTAA